MKVESIMDEITIREDSPGEFAEACFTTVVICGPPPPHPGGMTYRPNGVWIKQDAQRAYEVRNAWLDTVELLCLKRFDMDIKCRPVRLSVRVLVVLSTEQGG